MENQLKEVNKKYRIDEFLNNLENEKRLLAMRNLPTALNITRQTFSRWRKIKINEKIEIPSIKLLQIANFFETSVNDLINIDIPVVDALYLEKLDKNTTAEDLGLINS